MSDAPDTLLQPDPVCPYCGHKEPYAWELGDEDECECGSCGKEYWCSRVMDIRYTTHPIKERKP